MKSPVQLDREIGFRYLRARNFATVILEVTPGDSFRLFELGRQVPIAAHRELEPERGVDQSEDRQDGLTAASMHDENREPFKRAEAPILPGARPESEIDQSRCSQVFTPKACLPYSYRAMSPTITAILAVWGAVLSTITLVLTLRRDLTDRGKLKVSCYIGKLVSSGGLTDETPRLVYQVTNIGRRPVNVVNIGGSYKDGTNFAILKAELPQTLQPGEYFIEYVDFAHVAGADEFWASNSLSKRWKIPRSQRRALLAKYAASVRLVQQKLDEPGRPL